MKLPVYEQVLAINAGFEQVRRGFRALRRTRGFEKSAIERFSEQAEENRAAAMSYIEKVKRPFFSSSCLRDKLRTAAVDE